MAVSGKTTKELIEENKALRLRLQELERSGTIESRESNNIFTLPFSLSSSAGIDLTLSGPSVMPSAATVGQAVDLSCVIENAGDTDLTGAETKLRIYLSFDQSVSVGVDSLLSEYTFTDLASGGTDSYADSYTFSADYPVGDYFILFVVDPLDSITESNELNNQVSSAFSLASSSGVDLTISNIVVDPEITKIGETINITCDVNNLGESDLVSTTSWLRV